jgi:FMN-binding protein
MRKSRLQARTLGLVLGAGALALPALTPGTAAATTGHRTTAARSAKYTGRPVAAHQWGTVTVNVTVQTTGSGKGAKRKFTDLGGGYTYHTSRSQFIMSQALPILRQEFLAAQSDRIQMVSGATYTSEAFVQSLQSALVKAHA